MADKPSMNVFGNHTKCPLFYDSRHISFYSEDKFSIFSENWDFKQDADNFDCICVSQHQHGTFFEEALKSWLYEWIWLYTTKH